MKAQELSRKYATAVFSLALEKWQTALAETHDRLTADSKLTTKLGDMSLTFAERQKALKAIIPDSSDQHIRNFLYTMLKDGNISMLGDVLDEMGRMAEGGPQVQVARVTTAIELSESEKQQFYQKLRQKYGQTLELAFNVDPKIKGGAIVQIGDKIIDGSVATRLAAMSSALGVRTE